MIQPGGSVPAAIRSLSGDDAEIILKRSHPILLVEFHVLFFGGHRLFYSQKLSDLGFLGV